MGETGHYGIHEQHAFVIHRRRDLSSLQRTSRYSSQPQRTTMWLKSSTPAFGLRTISAVLIVLAISAVSCRPVGETPSEGEPLSVADGYIHYSVANDSRLREISRKAFESLISAPSNKQDYSSQEIIFRPHSQVSEKPEPGPKKHRKPGELFVIIPPSSLSISQWYQRYFEIHVWQCRAQRENCWFATSSLHRRRSSID